MTEPPLPHIAGVHRPTLNASHSSLSAWCMAINKQRVLKPFHSEARATAALAAGRSRGLWRRRRRLLGGA